LILFGRGTQPATENTQEHLTARFDKITVPEALIARDIQYVMKTRFVFSKVSPQTFITQMEKNVAFLRNASKRLKNSGIGGRAESNSVSLRIGRMNGSR